MDHKPKMAPGGPGKPGQGGPPGPRGMRGPRPKVKDPGKLLKRLIVYVFKNYKFHFFVAVIGIFISVFASVQGTMFMQSLIDEYITPLLGSKNPDFSGLFCV